MVNTPVVGVVPPTVPLMLIEAVPVRFVTVPLTGVPRVGVTKTGDVKVFAPANVCAPVVTIPPLVALAGCKVKVCPERLAPFAFGAAPIAASVTSTVFAPLAVPPPVATSASESAVFN